MKKINKPRPSVSDLTVIIKLF